MKKEEEWKTAFQIQYRHYKYNVMLFELMNASATCQEMINDALQKYLNIFIIAYLDNILVFFKMMKEHVDHIKKILKQLNKRNLQLKSEKCEFYKKDVNFLEFIVGKKGIRMNSVKINTVREWKQLINVKKIMSFLKFVNYNRKFIKDYFKKAISLINLTVKDRSWNWRKSEKEIFQQLRQACLEKSVLKMFNSKKSIRIETDASDLAIKVCLNQEHKDK